MGSPLTVLDAFAVIAALMDEPSRDEVEHLRYGNGQGVRISLANLAEVIDQLVRVKRQPFIAVDRAVNWLKQDGLDLVPVDEAIGRRAGQLRAVHYHRQHSAVSLADCLALATAEAVGEALATPDPALAAMARAVGVEVVALPDSQGRRP